MSNPRQASGEAETDSVEGSTPADLSDHYAEKLTDKGKTTEENKRVVLREFLRGRKPLRSINDLEAQVDLGDKTVERAVKGLQRDDIVVRRPNYNDDGQTALWYLNHPHSEYAVPPDITPAAEAEPRVTNADIEDIVTLRDRLAVENIVASGLILGTFLLFTGLVASVLPMFDLSTANLYGRAGIVVIFLSIVILVVGNLANRWYDPPDD